VELSKAQDGVAISSTLSTPSRDSTIQIRTGTGVVENTADDRERKKAMPYRGHVQNGVVVLDDLVTLGLFL